MKEEGLRGKQAKVESRNYTRKKRAAGALDDTEN